MLAGIYYGAQYGGSTTSILVNIPGESSSVVTCLDGYQMARSGRAGPALGMSAFGSYIGGTLGVIWLMLLANPMAEVALKFGPPEYFSLMCLSLIFAAYLSKGSVTKGLAMVGVGLFLSTIGLDIMTGQARFTFDIPEIRDGIGIVPAVMGLFGISEVLINLEGRLDRDFIETRIRNLLPTLNDWKNSMGAIFRGSILGFLLGIIPGSGAILASFFSYSIEKKISKYPEKFGTGVIEGVAGPETANNSASSGSFIPLLTLGIPGNPVTAILLAALMIHGIQPGPLMLKQSPTIFWGFIASMYLGNTLLLLLNLPLIGIWVKILRIRYHILFPLILLFCLIGAYTINSSAVDILIMVLFGIIGYIMRKLQYEAAPLVMAYVLGPLIETALRQSLVISEGRFDIFINKPFSAALLCCAGFLVVMATTPLFRRKKLLKALDID
jgi:putative tricarboxylic transport membrane protein